MPELPEVEVVKLFLEDKLLNKKIISLDLLNPKSFVGDPTLVAGQTITKFSRIGKQLSIYLSNKYILLVHLKMTGQLIFVDSVKTILGHPTKDAFTPLPNKSTRLIFTIQNTSLRNSPPLEEGVQATKQSFLYFNDQRKFGWIKLLTQEELTDSQSNLGLDIFDPNFSPDYIFSQLQRSSRPVKVVLLDQHFFAGIGNIYANDALFLSGIHPNIPSNRVQRSKVLNLHRAIIDIMRQSVLAGGSTAKDNKYLHPDGTIGGNQFFFRVYQRAGEPCLKCRAPIQRITQAGRGTFYCSVCQPL